MSRRFGVIQGVAVGAVLVVCVGIGFAGYTIMSQSVAYEQQPAVESTKPAESHDHDMNTMSDVADSGDLDTALTSLDDASFENDGQSEIDAQAAGF